MLEILIKKPHIRARTNEKFYLFKEVFLPKEYVSCWLKLCDTKANYMTS